MTMTWMKAKNYNTRLVCDPSDIVGHITLVRLGLGEIMLGCVSSDEVGLYFQANPSSSNLT